MSRYNDRDNNYTDTFICRNCGMILFRLAAEPITMLPFPAEKTLEKIQ